MPVGLLVSELAAVTRAENVTLVVEEMAEVRVVAVPLAWTFCITVARPGEKLVSPL